MEEKKDYAVLRFVDQNGWSYMVNDCVNGCSLMEYVKLGIQVEKRTAFEWIRQLTKQLEQFYRCGDDNTVYGYMNPYAMIIAKENALFLLDINELENEELLRQMNKKKIRMLFVRKERVLSQRTERVDDLYGLAKIMEFIAEKCLDSKAFNRKEERIWKRILGKCYGCGKNAIKVLKSVNKDLELLTAEDERMKKKVSGKMLMLTVLIICILSVGVVGVAMKRTDTKAAAADQKADEIQATKNEEKVGEKEVKTEEKMVAESPYLELGLLYYEAKEDYVNCLSSFEKETEETNLADAYRKVTGALEKDGIWEDEEAGGEDTVREILDRLENIKGKIQGKEYLYHYPLLKISVLFESEEGWNLAKRIGEEMVRGQEWYRWDKEGKKESEIRKYLAETYLELDENQNAAGQYEKIKETESNEEELEEIYEKLQLIYEEEQDYEKVWEICKEAIEVLPESEKMWIHYLERYLENPEMERELCVEAVKKAIQEVPDIIQSEDFKKLQEKYKIVLEDGNIKIGE